MESDKPSPYELELKAYKVKADNAFNENICKTASYTLTGLGAGLLFSFLFKNKIRFTVFSGGLGTGVGLYNFNEGIERFRLLNPEPQPPSV
jgi:uncharacterized membrane protein